VDFSGFLGALTLGENAESQGVNYAATTVANWSGTNPTDLRNALDRIAAKIGPIP
jgi:hypothetical protein